jgi:hypothetical protein
MIYDVSLTATFDTHTTDASQRIEAVCVREIGDLNGRSRAYAGCR